MMMRIGMPIDLQIDPDLTPPPQIATQPHLQALAALQARLNDARLQHEVCVRVCDAEESQALNRQYRGIDKPTNVLSFPTDPALIALTEHDAPLGDLAVCWPVVLEEAAQQGKAPIDHLLHLFVHGVLHLLGFDHEHEQEARHMEQLEVQTLAELGIANPYEPCH